MTASARPSRSLAPASAGKLTSSFLGGRILAAYGADGLARILDGFEAAAARAVTLRANALVATGRDIAGELRAHGIAWERMPWYTDAFALDEACERDVRKLPAYERGGLYLQGLSSMLPPLALASASGTDILDMCAAPGGKTSQIAALTGGRARITACEISAPRAARLSYNLAKLKVRGVQVLRVDARGIDELLSFDQVLLDAPCTGSGTARAGTPRTFDRISEALLRRVTRAQAALLDRALTVLKPGGELVYSTCSILPQENDDQIRRALGRHRDCALMGLDDGRTPVAAAARAGAFTLLPNRLAGTLTIAPSARFEGFYLAKVMKGASGAR